MKAALPYVAFVVVVLGTINFLWFFAETAPQALIPSDGKVVDGTYFLWSKTNGGYIEVSRQFWEWVRLHEALFFGTWPLVMLAVAFLVFRYLAAELAGRTSTTESASRVRRVRDSGPMLASTRSAGLIGTAWFSRPLLRLEVFPGGIVTKPMFVAEGAVLAQEIVVVRPEGGLSAGSKPERGLPLGFSASQVSADWRPRGPYVLIEHAKVGMASPIVISGSGHWELAQAIARIAAAERAQSTPTAPSLGDGSGDAPTGRPDFITTGLTILGIVMSFALIYAGIVWAIPQFGIFGVVWTVVIVVILLVNVWRFTGWRN
jgi:hypothetical protein